MQSVRRSLPGDINQLYEINNFSCIFAFCLTPTSSQVDKAAPEGAREKSIVIKGSAEAVERAKQLIHEKIGGGYATSNRLCGCI